MKKQDRQGARTPGQLEQKYDLGKRLEGVEKAIRDAENSVSSLDARLDQKEIFNRLTGNGVARALTLDKFGRIKVDAGFIESGILRSADGSSFYLDIDRGILNANFDNLLLRGVPIGSGGSEMIPATMDTLGCVIVGENLSISESGVLSVETASSVEEDNTKPITSAAVRAEVGNINSLLESI